MKKILIAVVSCAFVFCLSACSVTSTTTTSTTDNTGKTTTTTTTTTSENGKTTTSNTTTVTNTAANTNSAASALDTTDLKALSQCYIGTNADGKKCIFGADTANDKGAFVIIDTKNNEYFCIIGPMVEEADSIFAVTDTLTGVTLTFEATTAAGDSWQIDCGDTLGQYIVKPCTNDELIKEFQYADQYGIPLN